MIYILKLKNNKYHVGYSKLIFKCMELIEMKWICCNKRRKIVILKLSFYISAFIFCIFWIKTKIEK